MSYYFAMVGTKDAPIYSIEFGTYRQGGDGTARVRLYLFDILNNVHIQD